MENNIDTYFKLKVDNFILDLNKDQAWLRLKKKRIKNKIKYLSFAVAASLILGIILLIPNNTHKDNENIMSDFEKRQKLKEYEDIISGTYVETLLCYDCSGDIYRSQIKQVPENQWILEVY